MKKRWCFESEVELGKAVKACLEADGWELFAEVQYGPGSRRADFVGKRDELVAIFELKLTLSLNLMIQVHDWMMLGMANEFFAVVPRSPSTRDRVRIFSRSICMAKGIGLIEVGPSWDKPGAFVAQVTVQPKTTEILNRKLVSKLCQEHKDTVDAGTNGGGYVTDFSMTVRRMAEYLKENPGLTALELARAVKHHYAGNRSAAGALTKLGKRKQLAGIEMREVDGKSRFYASKQTDEDCVGRNACSDVVVAKEE